MDSETGYFLADYSSKSIINENGVKKFLNENQSLVDYFNAVMHRPTIEVPKNNSTQAVYRLRKHNEDILVGREIPKILQGTYLCPDLFLSFIRSIDYRVSIPYTRVVNTLSVPNWLNKTTVVDDLKKEYDSELLSKQALIDSYKETIKKNINRIKVLVDNQVDIGENILDIGKSIQENRLEKRTLRITSRLILNTVQITSYHRKSSMPKLIPGEEIIYEKKLRFLYNDYLGAVEACKEMIIDSFQNNREFTINKKDVKEFIERFKTEFESILERGDSVFIRAKNIRDIVACTISKNDVVKAVMDKYGISKDDVMEIGRREYEFNGEKHRVNFDMENKLFYINVPEKQFISDDDPFILDI